MIARKASAFAEASPLPLTRLDFGCIIKKNSECGDRRKRPVTYKHIPLKTAVEIYYPISGKIEVIK